MHAEAAAVPGPRPDAAAKGSADDASTDRLDLLRTARRASGGGSIGRPTPGDSTTRRQAAVSLLTDAEGPAAPST